MNHLPGCIHYGNVFRSSFYERMIKQSSPFSNYRYISSRYQIFWKFSATAFSLIHWMYAWSLWNSLTDLVFMSHPRAQPLSRVSLPFLKSWCCWTNLKLFCNTFSIVSGNFFRVLLLTSSWILQNMGQNPSNTNSLMSKSVWKSAFFIERFLEAVCSLFLIVHTCSCTCKRIGPLDLVSTT